MLIFSLHHLIPGNVSCWLDPSGRDGGSKGGGKIKVSQMSGPPNVSPVPLLSPKIKHS